MGIRPHDVGFDEFYGFYEAEKEIRQGVDKRRYPDLVLNLERLEMLKKMGSSDALIHGWKGGKTEELEKIGTRKDGRRRSHAARLQPCENQRA